MEFANRDTRNLPQLEFFVTVQKTIPENRLNLSQGTFGVAVGRSDELPTAPGKSPASASEPSGSAAAKPGRPR